MVRIASISIERSTSDRHFCGTVDFANHQREGTLLWTVDASDLKIDVAFVAGSDSDWDLLASEHASFLSENIILEIARRKGLRALASPQLFLSP